jgi:hypothetical protein
MKKILMSGDCRIGEIGKETALVDYDGNKLFSGDLVALSSYNSDQFEWFAGVEFVCNNEFQDIGLNKGMFVMGIRDQYQQTENELGETIVYQNQKLWRIAKVKGFEELVDGEKWGAVRVVFLKDDPGI